MHGVFDCNMDSSRPELSLDTKNPALRASSFLLDFLYPRGTVSFLRRLTPTAIDRSDIYRSGHSFAKVSPRLYSSSAPPPEPKRKTVGGDEDHAFDGKLAQRDLASEVSTTTKAEAERKGLHPPGTWTNSAAQSTANTAADIDTVPEMQDSEHPNGATERKVTIDETQDSPGDQSYHLQELMTLLVTDSAEDADKIWFHYSSLDEQSRTPHLGQTLVFLSKTGRVTDSWKISELFHQLDPSQWDSYSFSAGVKAEMNLQNEQRALDIFTKGLEKQDIDEPSLVTAFDLLLAAAMKAPSKDLLYDIWKYYDQMVLRWDFDTITKDLSHTAAVAGLPEKIIEFRIYFKRQIQRKGVPQLQKMLVRRALVSCADDQALTLLRMTNDDLAYEQFIRQAVANRRTYLTTQVYKVYRSLRDSRPSHAVLHEVFNAYSRMPAPAKFAGVEAMWGDWHTFNGTPTQRAYQKFMGFYASHGDKKRIYKLWKEYVQLYPEALSKGSDTFAHLLQVHAVRDELQEVQRIFDEISSKFNRKPNEYCWNILLNAYVKAGDYEGAISTMYNLSDAVGADRYSYGTLMQMAADRGDLGLVVDLYRRARRQRVPVNNTAILCSLVDAYCQNDHFQEAEDVCVRAAGRGMKETRLWNRILHAYALRRNLVSINRVLALMTTLEIPYDKYTYEHLLIGLSLCRQSQHALHLLAVAIKDNAFEVTEDHFHTLMGAFIKTGETGLAVRMHKLMQQCGFAESADSLVSLATAFGQWQRLPPDRRRARLSESLLGTTLSRFYKVYGIRKVDGKSRVEKRSSSTRLVPAGKLLRPGSESYHFSRMIYLFTQMKDFAKVQELIDLYRYVVYGRSDSTEPLPIQMLNSIMWADFSEKKYDRVESTWKIMFNMAQEGSVVAGWTDDLPSSDKVAPRFKYILSDGLKIMQNMYIIQEEPIGLQKLIEEVRTEGFELDSKNWNLYVQGLIKLKSYTEAFETCEKWLMPNWTGWYMVRAKENMKNQIPLDMRRQGTWPRYLRPVAHTLYYLAKGWMELDKLGPWSAEASRMLRTIREGNPRCYRAITSMLRMHTDLENHILGEEKPLMSAEDEEGEYGPDEEYGEQGEYLLDRRENDRPDVSYDEKGEYLPETESDWEDEDER